jgi:predicted lipoprotein with Yx(FWY)xxD motif
MRTSLGLPVSLIPVLVVWLCLALAAAAPRAAEDIAVPAEVLTMALGHGVRLTDDRGFTLYQYENDLTAPGTSTCVDECAVTRLPLLVAEPSQAIPGNWSMIEREPEVRQWAYRDMPLYRYARDRHPGVAYGEGDGWSVAFQPLTMPAEITIAGTVLGQVLADANGRTLYARAGSAKSFDCGRSCQASWEPLAAPWGAGNSGNFSVTAHDSGVFQWTYRDQPLYRYAGDASRGDLRGQDRDGVWSAVILEPAPPVPDWVTVVGSDGGALYADAAGMTLYRLLEDGNATELAYRGGNHCDAACLVRYWDPVLASEELAPLGYWSVIPRGDDTYQWAYKGMPVFTSRLETRPGQLYYTTYRQFQWMKPIMYALPALQGVF